VSLMSPSSLRVRVVLLVLIGALPAFALTLATINQWRRYEHHEARNDARAMVRLVEGHQQPALEATRKAVDLLARIPDIEHASPSLCAAFTAKELKAIGWHHSVAVIDRSGRVLCATAPAESISADSSYVRRAVESRTTAVAGEVDRVTRAGYIGFARPILDAHGVLKATVCAMLDLGETERLVAGADQPEGLSIILADDRGTILSHSPHGGRWVGKSLRGNPVFEAAVATRAESTVEGDDPDGVSRLFASRRLLGDTQVGNLYVLAGIDPRVAFSEINNIVRVSLFGLVLASVLSLGAAWFGSDVMVLRTLSSLLGAARRLTRGDLGARSGSNGGAAEVRQLATAFDDMAAALQARQAEADAAREALRAAHRDLEIRIHQRTADLVKANEALHSALIERERAEHALHKLSSAVEQAADSIIIANRDGAIEYVNPAFESLTGYTGAEAIGKTGSILKSGAHDDAFYGHLWQTILSGEPYRGVLVNRRKDGSIYFEEKTITPLRNHDGDITHFVSAGRDISDQKHAEEQLRESREQLRALTRHLESVREEERSRISREIHDELGQVLTGLKFDLSRLLSRPPDNRTDMTERVTSMITMVDDTIGSVRRIATELRPGVLDDLGLEAAIEWQAKEFEARTAIRCAFRSCLKEIELEGPLATGVFRILQETLTNVARHSGATQVDVTLTAQTGRLALTVADNGKGITAREQGDRRSLGLLGMRERALLLGGQISITGRPAAGTTVVLDVPLDSPPDDRAASDSTAGDSRVTP
jgi:PAS domain S-box-containing protein